MKASVLVVLYNSRISDIACLPEVLGSDVVGEIVVCDNSTIEMGNADDARKLGITYVPMGGNVGLSRAYNAGVALCKGDVVCVFDDDTEVDEGYFARLESLWFDSRGWDVLLPLVLAGEAVLSPSVFNGLRSRPFSSKDDVTDDSRLTGINSGMAVRRSVYDSVSYDESLFLDLVDHRFIEDVRRAGFTVSFGNGMLLRQDYSLETDSVDGAFSRIRIFERDAKQFYSGTMARRAYCSLMLLRRKATLCVKYRSMRFLMPGKKGRAS